MINKRVARLAKTPPGGPPEVTLIKTCYYFMIRPRQTPLDSNDKARGRRLRNFESGAEWRLAGTEGPPGKIGITKSPEICAKV